MRKLIRYDGTEVDYHGPQPMGKIKAAMGVRTVDTVALRHMGEPLHVMLCDDDGYEIAGTQETVRPDGVKIVTIIPGKARWPINAKATALYHMNCIPGTTHGIVGNVFICPDEDFA